MPEKSFQIRALQDVEPARITHFASEIWPDMSTEQVLGKWWWNGDAVRVLAAVAEDGGEVAGLCMGVPSTWALADGREIGALAICGWFVSPRFTGREVGRMLVKSLFAGAPAMTALAISDAAIRSFIKLGWTGPFSSHLLMLPLPLLGRLRRRKTGLVSRIYDASAAHFPVPLGVSLDRIDAEKPAQQMRRQRRAAGWRTHVDCHPGRSYQFHVLERDGAPVGYFVLRRTDEKAALVYRLARLQYVVDLVVNEESPALLADVFAELAAAADPRAGGLLLCTSADAHAQEASRQGWLSQSSALIGPRLASKAPKYMLGFDFSRLDPADFRLTFADSDLDHNI